MNKDHIYWAKPSEIKRWLRKGFIREVFLCVGLAGRIRLPRTALRLALPDDAEKNLIRVEWYGTREQFTVRGKGKFVKPGSSYTYYPGVRIYLTLTAKKEK